MAKSPTVEGWLRDTAWLATRLEWVADPHAYMMRRSIPPSAPFAQLWNIPPGLQYAGEIPLAVRAVEPLTRWLIDQAEILNIDSTPLHDLLAEVWFDRDNRPHQLVDRGSATRALAAIDASRRVVARIKTRMRLATPKQAQRKKTDVADDASAMTVLRRLCNEYPGTVAARTLDLDFDHQKTRLEATKRLGELVRMVRKGYWQATDAGVEFYRKQQGRRR